MDPYPYEYPVAYAAVPTYAGYHYYVVETVAVPPMKKPPRNFSAYDFFFGCFRGSTGNPFEGYEAGVSLNCLFLYGAMRSS
ncbi:unnamed protein product [Notodromas monacha]|uniref:Uncharacterized protein n=1 Tax=Notodromas monacha TaxID=399045 RepID=A0A7R9BI08_9CRUS|nr:unnamed protein product [Notodromas monacha]CAG0914493.1 unnamed protein product [Notodromas monacha]